MAYEHRYIWTVFDDGLLVPATPDHARDLPLAQHQGYGVDTIRLWLHHDLSHSVVMTALGFDWSPTLRSVATNGREPLWVDQAWRWEEEVLILGFQGYLNGGPEPPLAPAHCQYVSTVNWPALKRQVAAIAGS